MNFKRGKKGISPIIATVLLVILVIIIALIIFLWAKRFIGEAIVKNGASADQRCGEINLEASRISSTLYVNNRGNVPVYSIEVKLKGDGREQVVREDEIKLAPGQSGTYEISGMDSAQSVNIVPSVLGETKTSTKEYTCTKINVEVGEE
ncbi:MAG: archaellin/type IV pilin N-terminal domain-containing protein [Nanoarchaeota archaeon]